MSNRVRAWMGRMVVPVILLPIAVLAQSGPSVAPADRTPPAPVTFTVVRSKGGSARHGVLVVGSANVSYSDPTNRRNNFQLSCSDFLAGASLKQEKAGLLLLPAALGVVWPELAVGLTSEDVFQRIKAECESPGGASKLAFAGGVSYRVEHAKATAGQHKLPPVSVPLAPGVLYVREFIIRYSDSEGGYRTINVSCSNLADIVVDSRHGGWLKIQGEFFKSGEKGLSEAGVAIGIRDACKSQEAEHLREEERRLARQREEEAKQHAEERAKREKEEAIRREEEAKRRAEDAKRQQEEAKRLEEEAKRREQERIADFRNGILSALQAAEETEPFASIRGDLDLSAPDSQQWMTNRHFNFRYAEKCGLLRDSPTNPAGPYVWTLACMFRHQKDSGVSEWGLPQFDPLESDYERMVNSVQSVLNRPYQPDDKAENVNRVFFVDPSRPLWRLFVTKISDTNVGISIVAVRPAPAH